MAYPWAAGEVLTAADLNSAIAGKLDSALDQNTQTGTGASAYTFALADADRLTVANAATSATYTIPPQASVAWGTGDIIRVVSIGAGTVTFAGGAGVTVTNTAATLAQFQSAALVRTASNAWTVVPFSGGGVSNLKSTDVSATTGSPSITTSGTDTIYRFTGNGSITFSKSGLAQILVVSGGSGGGGEYALDGAGGGIAYGTVVFTAATHTVTVGAGSTTVGATATGNPGGIGGTSAVGSYGSPLSTSYSVAGPNAPYTSSISGSSVTYGQDGQTSVVANTGNGGDKALCCSGRSGIAGASGVVIVRVTT